MPIIDVVKFNSAPDVFAWKFPNEALATWTQLIVNETQEAVLFKEGKAFDVFGPGRYTLDTENIPILNKIFNLPFGGRSPFSAEVWFVNKVHSLSIKWGTPSPIQIQDPKYGVFIPLRSFGQFGIQVRDSKKFLMKLVGTLPFFDKVNITNYFRGLYLTKVKDSISSYLLRNGVSILEINAHLVELSSCLKEIIEPAFDEYGIELLNFYVNDVNVPEYDPAVKQLKGALAKKAEMEIVGYTYAQERSFDTLEGAATNPGGGQSGLIGAGIGLGMGLGIGNAAGEQAGGIAQVLDVNAKKECPNCNAAIAMANKFCPECGADVQAGKASARHCPGCGASIVGEKSKFCSICGEPLVNKCPGCGTEMAGAPRFCPECGKELRGRE